MVVGARQGGLSISETADQLRFSHTSISIVYREWSEIKKIFTEQQFIFCENALLMPEVRGEWPWFGLIERHLNTCYNQFMQKSNWTHNTLNLEADGQQQHKTTGQLPVRTEKLSNSSH